VQLIAPPLGKPKGCGVREASKKRLRAMRQWSSRGGEFRPGDGPLIEDVGNHAVLARGEQ
jgi:hypothetical protein